MATKTRKETIRKQPAKSKKPADTPLFDSLAAKGDTKAKERKAKPVGEAKRAGAKAAKKDKSAAEKKPTAPVEKKPPGPGQEVLASAAAATASTPPAEPVPAAETTTASAGAERSAPATEGNKAVKIRRVTAEELAKGQREISVSEFFAKNRHLLGFDNPRKALLTTIKEAVDNSLDACEEAGILPEVEVILRQTAEDRFQVTVEDNGPGILKAQIPNIFGKLLYGSKFHHLKMSRGQQGIGISAAGMYGMLTTGKPIQVTSRTGAKKDAHFYELQIDTKKNRPDIISEGVAEFAREHGTRVTIDLEAKYQRGRTSIDEYLRQTAIANPHAHLRYVTPEGEAIDFARTADEPPPQAKPVKPHPYGVELGVLIKMLKDTKARNLHAFLRHEFSRVSDRVADEIAAKANLSASARPGQIGRTEADRLFGAIQAVKIMAPSTDSVIPIGEENILRGLQSVVKADFYTAVSRPPAVYRGNPFIIEAGLAYGKPSEETPPQLTLGETAGSVELGEEDTGELVRLLRFANRVPLLYQQSACSMYRAMVTTNWRSYGLSQSQGALPTGPVVVMIHMASVWVPFTSESKEAVAHYPEIIKEIKLAVQECGRRLSRYLNRQRREHDESKKRSYIERYIPHIGIALRDILALSQPKTDRVVAELKDILEKSRKL